MNLLPVPYVWTGTRATESKVRFEDESPLDDLGIMKVITYRNLLTILSTITYCVIFRRPQAQTEFTVVVRLQSKHSRDLFPSVLDGSFLPLHFRYLNTHRHLPPTPPNPQTLPAV